MQIDRLFTRQQVVEMTGLPDDVLAYWIKEGLLVPSSGGSGRGRHRRFDWLQVTVGAVLGQMRRYGSNIAVLRSLAEIIQRGIRLDALYGLQDPYGYVWACSAARKLHAFRRGEKVMFLNFKDPKKGEESFSERPFESEDEILDDHFRGEPNTEKIREIASELLEQDIQPLRLLEALAGEMRTGQPSDNTAVLMGLDDNGLWRFGFSDSYMNFGSEADGMESAVMISMTMLLHRLWREDLIVLHTQYSEAASEEIKSLRAGRLADLDERDPAEARRLRRIWGMSL